MDIIMLVKQQLVMGLRVKVKVDHERVGHQDLVFLPRTEVRSGGRVQIFVKVVDRERQGQVEYSIVVE